jgi:hypothetical protein
MAIERTSLDRPSIVKFQVGDMLRVPGVCAPFHFGVYIGHHGTMTEAVVHNDKDGGVAVVPLARFALGRPITVETPAPGDWSGRMEVRGRALSLVGRTYDLLSFNCEHAANLARTGTASSGQVAVGVLVALLAAAFVFSEA